MEKRRLFEIDPFPLAKIYECINPANQSPDLPLDLLTLGYLSINVGDQTLLEYSPNIQAHWGADDLRFADQMLHYIERDLCGSLNTILEPIPPDVAWWMQPQADAPDFRWTALCSPIWRGMNGVDGVNCSLLANRICNALTGRWLQFDRLIQEPQIQLWASGDEVFVVWDNRERQVDGIPVWTATHGVYALPRETFIAELQDFRDRYYDAVARQLALVRAGALPPPGFRFDADDAERRLLEAQSVSIQTHAAARTSYTPVDWDVVRRAIQQAQEHMKLEIS